MYRINLSSVYVKFNTNLLHNEFIYIYVYIFIYSLMLRHVSALNVGHLQGTSKLLRCAACVSTTCNYRCCNEA